MLCPETWNFRAPESDFRTEKGDLPSTSCRDKINNFYFNHLVSVTVPDTLNVPKALTDTLVDDCEYYKVCDLDIGELASATFISNFIKKGILTLLTINRRIDCDDCLAVTPSGKLILSVTKESYQSLGLEGRESHFCTHNKFKYIVTIDLSELTPGTKAFQRIGVRLKTLARCDVILTWDPPEQQICPSSIAKYFDSLGYEVKLCKPQYRTEVHYSVPTPTIDFGSDEGHKDNVEWLGMLALDANMKTEEFVSSYEVPEPNDVVGQVRVFQWRGLYSCGKLEIFLNRLMEYENEERKPWVSMYVQGFSDSVVNWREREHHFFTNGDNSYMIFLKPDAYVVCSSMCTYKRYKKKDK